MALFGKIKKVFGFAEDDYEDEENNEIERSATVVPMSQRRQTADAPEPAPVTETTDQPVDQSSRLPEIPTATPDEIFTTVVKIFNESLPAFVKESVDAEAQRKYIMSALSDDMKRYVAGLEEIAENRARLRWHDERDRLREEMDSLQSKSKKIEDANAEWKEQKLSAERQKRALSERVHELEKQVVAFEAEREQFELENKSLVNKLRAISIQEGDSEALAAENNRLREEIVKLKSAKDPEGIDDETRQRFDALQKDNESLQNDVALLKKRCEIADAMINDLNHRASAAQKSLTEKEAALAEARAAANESQTKLDEAMGELEESRSSAQLFEQSLDRFEEIKSKKDAKIAQLKEALDDVRAQLDDAHEQARIKLQEAADEARSLRSTIENNLKIQAASEAALRQEIENMKSGGDYAKPRRRKPGKPKISSIDESLDDTDWLVPTPPEGSNVKVSGVADSEFGYQEPKRRNNPPENSAQMSLW